MRGISKLGEIVCWQLDELRHTASVIGTVLGFSVLLRSWRRGPRRLLVQQVVGAGIDSLGYVCAIAAFIGLSVVVQLVFWTGKTGQSQMLGPLLVAVVARELGPILANVVVIVRSSSVMVTHLGVLKIRGEVASLESSGGDAFRELVIPRVLGVTISTFFLTIIFILVAFASGYVSGAWFGKSSRDLWLFMDTVLNALHPNDIVSIVAKSTLPALYTSSVCCMAGLGAGGEISRIPEVTQKALTRGIVGLFLISATISLFSYL